MRVVRLHGAIPFCLTPRHAAKKMSHSWAAKEATGLDAISEINSLIGKQVGRDWREPDNKENVW